MKCLSLWEPWALLLVAGLKRVETRGWRLHHRGRLLVHAAKKWDPDLAALCLRPPFRASLESLGVRFTANEKDAKAAWGLPLGALVGSVEVADCHPSEKFVVTDATGAVPVVCGDRVFVNETEHAFGDYRPNRFGFLCGNAVRFATPIPCRGFQGLFDIPEDLLVGAKETA